MNHHNTLQKYVAIYGLLLFLIAGGCSITPSSPGARVRITLESGNIAGIEANVYFEDGSGQAVNGANVVILNSSGVAKRLDFFYEKYCYNGTLPLSSNGKYLVEIQSQLLGHKISRIIEHQYLPYGPNISVLRDQMGNNALTGSSLNRSVPIEIAWTSINGATVYQVNISSSGNPVFVASTNETSQTIPPNVFSGTGTYMVQISAQYIAGDVLLQGEDYYSFSQKSSPILMFSIN